jgi:hypothetical protein
MVRSEHEQHVSEGRAEYRWRLKLDQIEQLMERQGLSAEPLGGSTDHTADKFALRMQLGAGMSRLRAFAAELKDALLVDSVELDKRGDMLQVQTAAPLEAAVPLLELLDLVGAVPEATAVLGISESMEPLLQHFGDANTPHVLIIGDEAAGKTSLLRATAVALALRNRQSVIQFVAICPTSADRERHQLQENAWKPLNYLPHMLCDVAFRQTEIRDLLLFLVGEMNYRAKHRFAKPRIVVFIDQLDVVLQRGGSEAAAALHTLVQRGEDVGIHLMMSAREAEPSVFSPHLLSALPVRIVGRSARESAATLLNAQQTAEPAQLLGEGDFLVRQGGRLARFQAAFIDDYDLHSALSQMYSPQKRLLARPFSSRVHLTGTHKKAAETVNFVNLGGGMMAAD